MKCSPHELWAGGTSTGFICHRLISFQWWQKWYFSNLLYVSVWITIKANFESISWGAWEMLKLTLIHTYPSHNWLQKYLHIMLWVAKKHTSCSSALYQKSRWRFLAAKRRHVKDDWGVNDKRLNDVSCLITILRVIGMILSLIFQLIRDVYHKPSNNTKW